MKKILVGFFFLLATSSLVAQDTGKATYYGKHLNNKRTASGELYRRDSLVCAHRTYPFGTLLFVRNKKNEKTVIVRVIDRGPFSKSRIIDLSYAAAKQIEMTKAGVVEVEVSLYVDSLHANRD